MTSASIDKVEVAAYTVPTDRPESDGTYAWDRTTIVVVHARAGGKRGVGYTYADVATAQLIHGHLAAREAIGKPAALFVDANGAYTRKQALAMAERFAPLGVTWFEEPVSSDDLPGLHLLRDRGPAGMDIAAGEYGFGLDYFRRMLEAE